jgi:hypothetical protein
MSMEYNVECDKAICATEKGMTSPLYWAPVVYMDRSTYNDRVSLGNCAKGNAHIHRARRLPADTKTDVVHLVDFRSSSDVLHPIEVECVAWSSPHDPDIFSLSGDVPL